MVRRFPHEFVIEMGIGRFVNNLCVFCLDLSLNKNLNKKYEPSGSVIMGFTVFGGQEVCFLASIMREQSACKKAVFCICHEVLGCSLAKSILPLRSKLIYVL